MLGLPGDPVPDEAGWVEATIAGIRFISIDAPNGRALDSPDYPRKLAFFYDPPAFVGGTHVTDAERSRLQALLDLGLVDAYRTLHPTEVQYTWWDYRAGHFHRGLGLRIDLALISETLRGDLRRCGIERNFRTGTKPSDHAPLVVDLAGH